MQMEIGMALEMSDTLAEVNRRAANCTMYVIAFFEQKFSQERTILTCDTCD